MQPTRAPQSNLVFVHGNAALQPDARSLYEARETDGVAHAERLVVSAAPQPTTGTGGGAMSADYMARSAIPATQSNVVFAHAAAAPTARAAEQARAAATRAVPQPTTGTGGGAMSARLASRHEVPPSQERRRADVPARVPPQAAAGNHRRGR